MSDHEAISSAVRLGRTAVANGYCVWNCDWDWDWDWDWDPQFDVDSWQAGRWLPRDTGIAFGFISATLSLIKGRRP